jgi:hypothetical protein
MSDRPLRTPFASQRGVIARQTRHTSEAEKLVGIGFRCWWNGYETGEIACWEQAWRHYSDTLGMGPAKRALTDLSCWVRDVRSAARRPIQVHPLGCIGFCRDECLAVAMVAAAQHAACPVLRICAETLLGTSDIDGVLQSAGGLAETLTAIDKVLSPAAIIAAPIGNKPDYSHVH